MTYTIDPITQDALVADARGAEQRFVYAIRKDDADFDADTFAWEADIADDIACAAAYDRRPRDPLAVGMYRHGDDIYKVQKSRDSDNRYAKRLTPIGGRRLVDATGEVVNFEFVYAPGAIAMLSDDNRMTLDEAKEFGIRYGVCCVCGTTLADAVSVANGIGPVCAKRV